MLCLGILSSTATAAPLLDASTRAHIVEALAREVASQHAVPEKGARTAHYLRTQHRRGAYNNITDGASFAARLTSDMEAGSGDKHLQVFFSETPQQWIPAPPADDTERTRRLDQEGQSSALDNHGFAHAEVLPGNVGYIRLTRLARADLGGEAADAAMQFVRNADALVLDLRSAGGGDPTMAALLMGYLTGPNPQLMATSNFRSGRVVQYWTPGSLSGRRHPWQSKPVYLLTSENTFSAGEYLPFVLKLRGRATVVGEKTGGGAYGGHTVPLSPHYAAWISISRPVVPGAEGDWEARGVAPDVAAPAEHALGIAQAAILAQRAAALPSGSHRTELEWTAERLRAELMPVQLSPQDLQTYAGTFGERLIYVRDGELYHRRGDGPQRRLIPLGADRFALHGYDAFRLKFIREGAGAIRAIEAAAPGAQPVRHPKQ
jgi:hypothetical protein